MKTRTRILRYALCLVMLAVLPAARADVESPELAKYRDDVEKAVTAGLEWLKNNQLEDGTFPGPQHSQSTAIVGLAGMAFLSQGNTPGQGPYGEAINRCIDYIVAHQDPNGYFNFPVGSSRMYGHGIDTLFLSEVSGMVDPERQEKIDEALSKALKLILTAQQVKKSALLQGGWRYEPTSGDSDISVTGWNLLALRSARLNGAEVPKSAIDEATGFVLRMRHPTNGGFGYAAPGDGAARTGVGLLCLELTGHHDGEETRAAGDYLLGNMGGGFITDGQMTYAVYYCAQGMFQLGGEHWEKFGAALYTHCLKTQQADGRWADGTSDAYGTSMYVLAMTVSYRQLPIYQR